jgi:hypothetical protein
VSLLFNYRAGLKGFDGLAGWIAGFFRNSLNALMYLFPGLKLPARAGLQVVHEPTALSC